MSPFLNRLHVVDFSSLGKGHSHSFVKLQDEKDLSEI